MPIPAPTMETGALILTLPATGIQTKRADGTLDTILSWNAVTGDLTVTPPVGTTPGGGSRSLRVTRPVVLLSELNVTPAAGAASVVVKSVDGQAIGILDRGALTAACHVFRHLGVPRWGVGLGVSTSGDHYEFWNYTRSSLDGYIDAGTGALTWLRGLQIGPAPLVISSTSGAGMLRIGVGVDATYSAGQGLEFTFDVGGSGGYGANTAIINSLQRGVGCGYRQLAIESQSLYLNLASLGVVVIGTNIGGAGTLRVGGGINGTAYYVNGRTFIDGSNINYTIIVAPTGSNRILLGNAGVPTIYYESDTHSMYNAAATTEYARFDTASAGVTSLSLQDDSGILKRVKTTAASGAVPAGFRTLYV